MAGPKPKYKYPQVMIDKIRVLFEEEGKSVEEIKKVIKVRVKYIYSMIGENGMRSKHAEDLQKDPEERKEKIRKALATETPVQVAIRFGLHPRYVSQLVKNNWEYSDAYNAAIKNRDKKLYSKIYYLHKKGLCKDVISKKLGITYVILNKLAGNLDFSDNTERARSESKERKSIRKDKIVEEYKTGLVNMSDLAKKYGCVVSTVSYIIKAAGLCTIHILGKNGVSLETYAKTQHLHDKGWPDSKIAEFLREKESAIYNRLRYLEKRREQIRQGVKTNILPSMDVGVFEEILKMIKEGVSGVEIGRRTGYTRAHICSIKKGRVTHPDVIQ